MALSFLDTNILVRHFTQDNIRHSPKASAFLREVDLNISFADAYHAVVMEDEGITDVVTFDREFDRVPGIRRVEL